MSASASSALHHDPVVAELLRSDRLQPEIVDGPCAVDQLVGSGAPRPRRAGEERADAGRFEDLFVQRQPRCVDLRELLERIEVQVDHHAFEVAIHSRVSSSSLARTVIVAR